MASNINSNQLTVRDCRKTLDIHESIGDHRVNLKDLN